MRHLGAALGSCFSLAVAANAATIQVGPDQPVKVPSEAAKLAKPGDTIEIAPGEYYDCTVWTVPNVTIEATESGAVITDTTCQGKALFVVAADHITIRGLTLQRARVPDGNGAGLRAEANGLIVEHCRFVNDETAILAADQPSSTIEIRDSQFLNDGACAGQHCVAAVNVGAVSLLRIEHTQFSATRSASVIVSSAARTEILNDDISDGSDGSSSYLIEIRDGGALAMENSQLEKGPQTSNRTTAILLGLTQSRRPAELRFTKNIFKNDSGYSTDFVLDWTGVEPVLTENRLIGPVTELSTSGAWLHRLAQLAVDAKDNLRHMAGKIRRAL